MSKTIGQLRREIEGDQENSPEWIPIHDEVSLRRYCLALLAEHEAVGEKSCRKCAEFDDGLCVDCGVDIDVLDQHAAASKALGVDSGK